MVALAIIPSFYLQEVMFGVQVLWMEHLQMMPTCMLISVTLILQPR